MTISIWIINKFRQNNIIDKNGKFLIWFAGFRGAMAYALSLKSSEIYKSNRVGDIMLTMTLIYI